MSLQSKAGTEVSQISYPLIQFIVTLPSFTCHSRLFCYYYWEALRHCEIILMRTQETKSFPGGSDSKESVCNAGEPGSIPGSGRSRGEGNGCPVQYSCLENSMDGGAWQATVHGVAKSQTQLKWLSFSVCRSISGFSVLFHWSICLSFNQYHTALIIEDF